MASSETLAFLRDRAGLDCTERDGRQRWRHPDAGEHWPLVWDNTDGEDASYKSVGDLVVKSVRVPLSKESGAGGLLSWANPEGKQLLVQSIFVFFADGGANTADFGVAPDSETSVDNLLDGISLDGGGYGNSINNSGTNGLVMMPMGPNDYIMGTCSGTPAGTFSGVVVITYSVLGDVGD